MIQSKPRTQCTPELNKLLFDLLGAKMLKSATEEQLIWHIWLVAVRRGPLTEFSLYDTEGRGVNNAFLG